MAEMITIRATEREWRALHAALPKCGCRMVAELRLNGLLSCVTCAAGVRRGRCETLEYADIVTSIEDAIGGAP